MLFNSKIYLLANRNANIFIYQHRFLNPICYTYTTSIRLYHPSQSLAEARQVLFFNYISSIIYLLLFIYHITSSSHHRQNIYHIGQSKAIDPILNPNGSYIMHTIQNNNNNNNKSLAKIKVLFDASAIVPKICKNNPCNASTQNSIYSFNYSLFKLISQLIISSLYIISQICIFTQVLKRQIIILIKKSSFFIKEIFLKKHLF